MQKSRIYWANLISRFVNRESRLKYEWDDFISTQIDDVLLDEIRQLCGEVSFAYPSSVDYCSAEGMRILEQVSIELKNPNIPLPLVVKSFKIRLNL